MRKRAFVAAALLSAISAGAGESPCALKKALIAPRLDAALVERLKSCGYDGVELTDKKATVEEARAARKLAEANSLRIHSFMGGWFKFNSHEHYEAIRNAMARYGYNGWVSIETRKRTDAEHAAFMDDFFKGNVPARGYLFGRRP